MITSLRFTGFNQCTKRSTAPGSALPIFVGMFTKLDLIERIIATTDEKVLEKVGDLLAKEPGEFSFSKEHLALLEERRERRRKGEGKGYGLTEVRSMLKTKRR